MSLAIAFDVYGTLIDPAGVLQKVEDLVGTQAASFSKLWRSTQINYSFRRSILGRYEPFTRCTEDALQFTCLNLDIVLTAVEKKDLMQQYLMLPTFDGVTRVLKKLHDSGHQLYAFSNGATADLEALFLHAGVSHLFEELISVDPVKKFKPDPAVYAYLQEKIDATGASLLFVSANPFDVQGALNAGLRVSWLRRSAEIIFDPWDPQPTNIIKSLEELCSLS